MFTIVFVMLWMASMVLWLYYKNLIPFRCFLYSLLPMGTGAFLNWLVQSTNGGKMPVLTRGVEESTRVIESATHTLLNEQTEYAFLADIIDFGIGMSNIGDVLLILGMMFYVFYGWYILRRQRGTEREVQDDIEFMVG